MRKAIYEIVKLLSVTKNQKEKVKILQENSSPQLVKFMKIATDKNIQWYLPEGTPPFTPLSDHGTEDMLYMQVSKLYVYYSDSDKPSPLAPAAGDDVKRKKFKENRLQTNFQELLESVHPEDAKILIAVKDKKNIGVNSQIVKKAFG